MGRKLFRILRHAVTMVRRNLRSYAMLSVTIVISFSLLLGFLTLMDSDHYSDYKHLFAQDRSLVTVTSDFSQAMVELMEEKASELGTTHCTQALSAGSFSLQIVNRTLETGEELSAILQTNVQSLPRQTWYIWSKFVGTWGEQLPVTWVDGKEHPNYDLKPGEILIDEQLFYALGMDQGDRTVELQLTANESKWETKQDGTRYLTNSVSGEFTVVGTVPSTDELEVRVLHNSKNQAIASIYQGVGTLYAPILYFSLDDLSPSTAPDLSWSRTVTFYTDEPEQVHEMITAMDSSLDVYTVYDRQNEALETIQTEKGTKAMVAILLLLLLGINLYSSFDNALNDRKFEIGVKRAVGASAFSIVRQFFYEGLVVMAVDILLSVAIVTDVAIVYKFIKEAIPDQYGNYIHYVLYISPYSIAIFVICALVLTVVFSFVFAYKSTQVQIVDYLKAE